MSDKAFSDRDHAGGMDPEKSRELTDQLKAFTEGETISPSQLEQIGGEPEAMAIQHRIPRRKGSWYLLPKDMPDPTDD